MKNRIKQITTLNHAPYAEVFIRTLKQLIHERLEGEGNDLNRLVDVYNQVLANYKLTEHSSIKMSPHEARKSKNKMDVYFNKWAIAKHDRIYKPLSVGDSVRIMVKELLNQKLLILNGQGKYIELKAKMGMTTLLMKTLGERYI